MHEETLRTAAARPGTDLFDTLMTRNNLALAYSNTGGAEAIAITRRRSG